jgi:hypothetical protein
MLHCVARLTEPTFRMSMVLPLGLLTSINKMVLRSLEKPGFVNPAAQCNISEDRNPQYQRCGSLKSRMHCCSS